jgi:maleate isomerase
MWQPDGWDVRTRIGVLTPHADVGPKSEIRAMAPETVGVHAARVPFGAVATGGAMDPTIPLASVAAFVEPPHIDDAVSLLAAAPVAVIGIGFTSSSYVTGADAEKDLERPVVTANQVLLWGMLQAVRSRVAPRGYGQLLTLTE